MILTKYLNMGTGKACAGHNIAKLCPKLLTNHANLSSVENAGDLDPTGSVKRYECVIRKITSHLNSGTGNP